MTSIPSNNLPSSVNANKPIKNSAKSQPQQTEQSEHDKKIGKFAKAFIGATALAAVVTGGILLHNKNIAKKALKEIDSLTGQIQRQANGIEHYSPENIFTKLEEISKISNKDERLKALKTLDAKLDTATNLNINLNFESQGYPPRNWGKGMETLPEDVRAAHKEKDAIKTAELFQAHLDKLPDTYVPVNRGTTVAETIENTFGKNSGIKPHTYDLANENPELHVYRNYGGYKDGLISKEGISWGTKYTPTSDPDIYMASSYGFANGHVGSGKDFSVSAGKFSELNIHDKSNLTNPDRKVVKLTFNPTGEVDTLGNPINAIITVMSPNNKYTPLQQDLIKLAKNPKKFDASIISRITEVTSKANSKYTMGQGKFYENCDYDLLLSAIQSMANK